MLYFQGEGDLTSVGIDLQAAKQFLECELDFINASLSVDILHNTSCRDKCEIKCLLFMLSLGLSF
jgi:hypothetical protein